MKGLFNKLTIVILTLIFFSCNQVGKPKGVTMELEQNINILTLAVPQSAAMEALTKGTLTVNSSGCLKVGVNTIIWPYGFTLGKQKNVIYNATGSIVAKVGDHIQLSGGGCANCSKEHIKKLIGKSPNDICGDNYWIVGEEISVK